MDNPSANAPADPWAGSEMLSSYSRADALADGVLVDVTAEARAVGVTCPVALTAGVFDALGADDREQLARAVVALRVAAGLARGCDTDRVDFHLRGRDGEWVRLWALCGPGDTAEGVITVMLEGED